LICKCIICNKILHRVDNEEDIKNPPMDGIYFSSVGNYGSSVYDGGEFEGHRLEIYVCDECLKDKADQILFIQKTKTSQKSKNIITFQESKFCL